MKKKPKGLKFIVLTPEEAVILAKNVKDNMTTSKLTDMIRESKTLPASYRINFPKVFKKKFMEDEKGLGVLSVSLSRLVNEGRTLKVAVEQVIHDAINGLIILKREKRRSN